MDNNQAEEQRDARSSSIVQVQDKPQNPIAGFITIINVMLGTGPIFLPGVFLGDGYLMSTIFVVVIGCISWLMGEYLIESMSLLIAIEEKDRIDKSQLLSSSENQSSEFIDKEPEPDNYYSEKSKMFKLNQTIEYTQMATLLWGKVGKIIVVIILTVYIMGILITKCISTGMVMKKLFGSIDVLDNFYFWLALFFLTSMFFCFRDVQGTKVLQTVVSFFRAFVILLMICGALYLIGNRKKWSHTLTPGEYKAFHLDGFEDFFSTAVFAFMCHHSIPSMLRPVKPARYIKTILYTGFATGATILIIISLTGILAFGDLYMSNKEKKSYYNMWFDDNINWIYYIISFYLFFNITAFPVLVITTRNNLMKCIVPNKIPVRNWEITKWTFAFTIFILAPVLIIASITQKIQNVIDLTSGIFGVLLLFIIPSSLVLCARAKAEHLKLKINDNPHQAYISFKYLPYFTIFLGLVCLCYNIYKDVT